MIAESEEPLSGVPRPLRDHQIPSPHGSLIHGRRILLGPRRSSIVLALLALGLLVASAGVAAASDGAWSHAPTTPAAAPDGAGLPTATWTDHGKHGGDPGDDDSGGDAAGGHGTSGHDTGGHDPDSGGVGTTDNGSTGGVGTTDNGSTGGVGTTDNGSTGGPTAPDDGHSSGGDTGGDVTGTSVDIPSTPVQAPAPTASGPAPDAVAPAPIISSFGVFVPAGGSTGTDAGAAPAAFDGVAPAADLSALVAPAAPTGAVSLVSLPELGTIGSLASSVPGGTTDARALLSSGTGRSVAVVLALLAAILVFLAIHRRVDRSDPKLAAARTGPDLARFR